MIKEDSGRDSDINNKMQVNVERDAESNDRQTENSEDENDLKTKFMQQKRSMIWI